MNAIDKHKLLVAKFIGAFVVNLTVRSATHDLSKAWEEEKEFFLTPQVKYWSKDYQSNLSSSAIAKHYERNDHHPQHFPNGINDMSITGIIEMVCDWLAASAYNEDGHFERSLAICFERFGIEKQLQNIIINSLREMGYYPIDGEVKQCVGVEDGENV